MTRIEVPIPQPKPEVTGPRCETCPRWLSDNNGKGRCRLLPPMSTVVGIGQGLGGPRDAAPVTVSTYRISLPTDQCVFHPEILYGLAANFLSGLVPLIRRAWDNTPVWTREGGFTRAPSLREAMDYAPGGPKGPRPIADADKGPE